MNWTECKYVERVADRCSGLPTVLGTRVFPETILQYSNRGASEDEILGDFPTLTADLVRSLLEFAHDEQRQLAS